MLHTDLSLRLSKAELAIRAEAERATKLALEVENLNNQLAEKKRHLDALLQDRLPAMMHAARMTEFKTVDGFRITIRDFVRGSLPREQEARDAAFAWIESVGARDIIKEQISLAFGKGDQDAAEKAKRALISAGAPFSAKLDVHAQTLYAFARERFSQGEEVPLAVLGLIAGQEAKITLPPKV